MSGKQTAIEFSVTDGIARTVLNRPEEGNRASAMTSSARSMT
jgi:hypothetical protein